VFALRLGNKVTRHSPRGSSRKLHIHTPQLVRLTVLPVRNALMSERELEVPG